MVTGLELLASPPEPTEGTAWLNMRLLTFRKDTDFTRPSPEISPIPVLLPIPLK